MNTTLAHDRPESPYDMDDTRPSFSERFVRTVSCIAAGSLMLVDAAADLWAYCAVGVMAFIGVLMVLMFYRYGIANEAVRIAYRRHKEHQVGHYQHLVEDHCGHMLLCWVFAGFAVAMTALHGNTGVNIAAWLAVSMSALTLDHCREFAKRDILITKLRQRSV